MAQPKPLSADVNGVLQVGGAGIYPAGSVARHNSLGTGSFHVAEGDGEHPVAGQGLQLPPYILQDMANLAAELGLEHSPGPNDLHDLLIRGGLTITLVTVSIADLGTVQTACIAIC